MPSNTGTPPEQHDASAAQCDPVAGTAAFLGKISGGGAQHSDVVCPQQGSLIDRLSSHRTIRPPPALIQVCPCGTVTVAIRRTGFASRMPKPFTMAKIAGITISVSSVEEIMPP